ncbi:NAD(P)/FAD-dependent oxidoreductase [Flavobacterium sp. MAH-1]|uniref:NAD(P)/FAD-dependent oxidoreductase n=1 Tax=Flavobacterium agri TaxID=2743471 RepID=A0A7Y8XZY2_9FLAO|nr:NAD(P)/FAD-dependent oxidoreductase [Flavobacterium agri]NUY79928.1 NAD(P)/FAD-dependent oxidoreductase [Flavobacterium agri]NYA69953.1 NAD(P)/FAD-dependent oxidoreductase [Flavobacterium agri]
MVNNRVIIVGGGLAGLTAAIHLSKTGNEVTLVEKQEYPKHKVCGEYISNEVMPYLDWLDVDLNEIGPVHIKKAVFSTVDGKQIQCDLPLGGIGISRYALDNTLYKTALRNGCRMIRDSVSNILFDAEANCFSVVLSNGQQLSASVVLGAFGKRSGLDQKLDRDFIHEKSPWLAVKMHYSGDYPDDLVGLHNFDGGYCGVSKVENGAINVCYLADFESFKKYKNIEEYESAVVCANPHLSELFDNFVPLLEQPVTISQVSFAKKEPVENHILMIGDTAGLIHPLCGNGMAMAIHSAKLASECVNDYLESGVSRQKMEENYADIWNYNFKKRLKTGRLLAAILQKQGVSRLLLRTLSLFPSLLPQIIRMTHGKPLKIAA